MDVFNLHGDEWDRTEDREGWRSKDAWIGHRLGAELLGGSLYELAPGDRLFPYHVHHANEEWIVVVQRRADPAEALTASSSCARVTSRSSGAARRAPTRSRTAPTPRSGC